MSAALPWLLAALPLLALGFTALNLATWRRGRAGPRAPRGYAVLIPARDEEDNIVESVRAALEAGADEVLVYDDGSTDRTPELLSALGAEEPRLTVLRGRGLPEGWLGKPHACARLAEACRAERLVFVDADVRLRPAAMARLHDLFCSLDADVVTAVPQQRMLSPAERLLMPMLHLTYVSWFWLELVHRSADPRLLAANGQVLAVRKASYEALGGFEAVRDQVVDDMAFCRAAKRAGRKVVFADGHRIAECRMYRGLQEIWGGFTKNLYPGIGARPTALALVLTIYGLAFIAPWIALAAAGLGLTPSLLLPAALGVAANLLTRAALVVRLGHPFESILTSPLGALGFCAVAIGSWWKVRQGSLTWRGRSVAAISEASS